MGTEARTLRELIEQHPEWAENYETMVLLNGGFSESLRELNTFLDDNVRYTDDNYFPFASFKESNAALDGALTCVGIIVPEYMYEGAKKVRGLRNPHDFEYRQWERERILTLYLGEGKTEVEFSEFEVGLMQYMNECRLAQ